MRYLVDTTVVSELRKDKRCNDSVRVWAESVGITSCYLSVVVILEVKFGINKVRKTDCDFANELERWLSRLLKAFDGRVLNFGIDHVDASTDILAGKSRGDFDTLLLGTAKAESMTVATRNVKHFQDAGVSLVNPWDYPLS